MCTVSWIHEEGGYQLLCNRDEKKTRRQADPPQIRTQDRVRYIAPRDGDHGGTWIATNEHAMTLCLLNGTPKSPRFIGSRSRGHLIPSLIGAQSLWEVSERLWCTDLSCYAPFLLIGLEPGSPATLIEWDGIETFIVPYADPYMPVTSSSFDPDAVRQRRKAEFARLSKARGRIDTDLLFFFHENHGAHPDAYSTCMHRQDAETVSFSWVRITHQSVDFLYSPGAPCQWRQVDHSILERAA
jgi:hypothetical protein